MACVVVHRQHVYLLMINVTNCAGHAVMLIWLEHCAGATTPKLVVRLLELLNSFWLLLLMLQACRCAFN
jgi:hypothetical protein